jgi:tetratricopeptide (TPR) repeat protein
MRSRVTAVTASLLLAACLCGSILVRNQVDRVRTGASLQEVLYISSPKLLKNLSLGYSGLLADIYWTRAVQYFGGKHHVESTQYELLGPLLEITTYLDPHLLVAYEFGANFLAPAPPLGAAQPDRAVKLVQSGIRANPDSWKLYKSLGFIYYFELKDYPKAAEAFEAGSKIPGAHPALRIMAANMAQHAGDLAMARMLWITTYQTIDQRAIRANAIGHLRALQVDQDVTTIQNAVTAYGTKTGSLPPSMNALIRAGFLPGLLIDPDGHPYKLTAEGRVEVAHPDDFPFITKGVPPGYKAPPVNLDKVLQ